MLASASTMRVARIAIAIAIAITTTNRLYTSTRYHKEPSTTGHQRQGPLAVQLYGPPVPQWTTVALSAEWHCVPGSIYRYLGRYLEGVILKTPGAGAGVGAL